MEVAVIGGGAAGFFAAFSVREHHPGARITLYEKSTKVLAKVKVSGGGRCNVTHSCFSISDLIKHYPRGARFLKKAFHQFYTEHTVEWFESRGVELKTEQDGRMFPVSNSSQTIIDLFQQEAEQNGIEIKYQSAIVKLSRVQEGIELHFSGGGIKKVDNVIICSGGSPKISGLRWLEELGHSIEPPVPSLFTFNMPNEKIKSLMGLVAPNTRVKVQGEKLEAMGPLLITHWGMSGPAILKLSAFGARLLAEKNYAFKVQVNWVNSSSEDEFRRRFVRLLAEAGRAKLGNLKVEGIPKRLWHFILGELDISAEKACEELSKKDKNKVINALLNSEYEVRGKTTFKEEFVTCGGIALSDINPNTMQSKVIEGLYFAGEVLDIDGVTGGFNFQAAWTTGYIAGKLNPI